MKIREIKELLNDISEEYDDFDFVIKAHKKNPEDTEYITDIEYDHSSRWSNAVFFEGKIEVE